MKRLIAAFACLSLTASASPAKYDDASIINSDTIVRVECVVPLGVITGTAVRISPTTYATATHVVSDGECSVDGVPIKNVESNKETDFATFRGPKGAYARPSCRGFKTGSRYLAIGYAGGGYNQVGEAWTATRWKIGGMQVFVGNGYPGMSGGPVFAENGDVVGVVNMRWPTRSQPLKNTPICKD